MGLILILNIFAFVCFQSKAIEDIIEDMLVRLDEFSHLADTVRNNDEKFDSVLHSSAYVIYSV